MSKMKEILIGQTEIVYEGEKCYSEDTYFSCIPVVVVGEECNAYYHYPALVRLDKKGKDTSPNNGLVNAIQTFNKVKPAHIYLFTPSLSLDHERNFCSWVHDCEYLYDLMKNNFPNALVHIFTHENEQKIPQGISTLFVTRGKGDELPFMQPTGLTEKEVIFNGREQIYTSLLEQVYYPARKKEVAGSLDDLNKHLDFGNAYKDDKLEENTMNILGKDKKKSHLDRVSENIDGNDEKHQKSFSLRTSLKKHLPFRK